MSPRKEEMEKIGEKIKKARRSYIDEVAEKALSTKKTKNRKITLSLPEDVIKTLWILKAEKGYPSISKIVAEAVRKYAGEVEKSSP
ncbi:MAG TPA: hypothetical protein ENG67_05670 [candidate division WOR-3 bacterium]|uniref:Uncharacterized protein n=1 Tax=candidate division WOR-3 bacterium TaxID=2052148 RepID=A0A7C1BAR4_UNCW3|nr:hypothetical protein [candidate division WOR-3 bacterium]